MFRVDIEKPSHYGINRILSTDKRNVGQQTKFAECWVLRQMSAEALLLGSFPNVNLNVFLDSMSSEILFSLLQYHGELFDFFLSIWQMAESKLIEKYQFFGWRLTSMIIIQKLLLLVNSMLDSHYKWDKIQSENYPEWTIFQ